MRCTNLFRFLLGFYGPGEQQLQMWSGLQCRERKKKRGEREREEGTLAACLHFRFFTPRLGFDCGLSGSKQPPAAVANLSMYLALDTWPGVERERGEKRGSKKRRVHTARHCRLAIALLLAGAGVYLMPTVLACCPRQIWHWLFKLSDREFVVTC